MERKKGDWIFWELPGYCLFLAWFTGWLLRAHALGADGTAKRIVGYSCFTPLLPTDPQHACFPYYNQ